MSTSVDKIYDRQRRRQYAEQGRCACGKPRKPGSASCQRCIDTRAKRADRKSR